MKYTYTLENALENPLRIADESQKLRLFWGPGDVSHGVTQVPSARAASWSVRRSAGAAEPSMGGLNGVETGL